MNQFFNIKRFGQLLSYDLKINYKQYLIAVGICFIVSFVLTYIIFIDSVYDFDFRQYGVPFVMSFFLFVVFAGLSFPAFSSKKNTITYLTLPASTFEKYTAEFIIRIIFGGILFLVIFWLAANCAAKANVFLYNLVHDSNYSIKYFSYSPIVNRLLNPDLSDYDTPNRIRAMGRITIPLVVFPTLLVFAFSVRLFFRRFAIVKTAAVAIGIILILIWFIATFAEDFLAYYWDTLRMAIVFNRYVIVICAIFCVTLLLTGYYKLKEKKI